MTSGSKAPLSGVALAVKAGIPIIAVSTTDTINARFVLQFVTSRSVVELDESETTIKASTLYLWTYDPSKKTAPDFTKIHPKLISRNSVLVCVNLPIKIDSAFDAGVLHVPKEFIAKTLISNNTPQNATADQKKKLQDGVDDLMPAFGGLTIKEASEVYLLTEAREGKVTRSGVNRTRKEIIRASTGLQLVDTDQTQAYVPNKILKDFVDAERSFFLNGEDPRLRPRGILLTSKLPGTGKTQAAKYIAHQWGVPLFRLDATVQSKWVGETEGNFAAALSQVEFESPAVLLIDEIEKFMGNSHSDSTGIMTRVIGSFLWWLQEHRARVLTIMTCNHPEWLLPELHREGRIDAKWMFPGLKTQAEVLGVANPVAQSYGVVLDEKAKHKLAQRLQEHKGELAHSFVAEYVRSMVKSGVLKNAEAKEQAA